MDVPTQAYRRLVVRLSCGDLPVGYVLMMPQDGGPLYANWIDDPVGIDLDLDVVERLIINSLVYVAIQ